MRKSAFEYATELYGDRCQLIKTMEECGELVQAIAQHLLATHPDRHPNTDYDPAQTALRVISESVDVEIMIGQLKAIFNDPAAWSLESGGKMTRLWGLLKRDGADVGDI